MIDRLITDWWTNTTERVYQQPFAAILVAKGHKVIHVSRHCAMELGKDVISIDKQGVINAYQLKTCKSKRISISQWQSEISPQLADLVESPVTHASIGSSEKHQPWLVFNADIDEEVTRALEDRNKTYSSRFGRTVKTIVLGQLVEDTLAFKESLWATSPENIKLLLESYLEEGKRNFNKERFSTLLNNIFRFEEDEISKSDFKRRISLIPILTSFALRNHSNCENWCAEIDAWMMCWAYIHAAQLRSGLSAEEVSETKNAVKVLLFRALDALALDAQARPTLFQEGSEYALGWIRFRSIWVIGVLSALAIEKRTNGLPDSNLEQLIEQVCSNKPTQPLIWGEAVVPHYLAYSFMKSSKTAFAKGEWPLITLFEVLLIGCGHNSKATLCNPYLGADDFLRLSREKSSEKAEYESRGYSWYLAPIIDLMVQKLWRRELGHQWDRVSSIRSEWFQCAEKWQEFIWNSKHGTNNTSQYPTPTSWAGLRGQFAALNGDEVTADFDGSPAMALLYLMTFPHRVSRSLIKSISIAVDRIGV